MSFKITTNLFSNFCSELKNSIDHDDLEIALYLFHQIASDSNLPSKITSPLPSIADTIDLFMRNNFPRFKEICLTGFPFSFLNKDLSKNALKDALRTCLISMIKMLCCYKSTINS